MALGINRNMIIQKIKSYPMLAVGVAVVPIVPAVEVAVGPIVPAAAAEARPTVAVPNSSERPCSDH